MIPVVIIVFVLVGGLIAVLAIRAHRRPKAKAPEAVWWIGPASDPGYAPIGLKIEMEVLTQRLPYLSETENGQFIEILEAVQKVCGVTRIEPVVVVFRAVRALILADGHPAAGLYHTANEWDHPWIELAVGRDGAYRTLRETAFAHELLHHASGLADTPEFRALHARLQEVMR